MVFYRDILGRGAQDRPVRGGPRDRRRGPRVRDAGRRDPGLPAQGGGHREGRHLRPAGPPRRGPAADHPALGHLRADRPRRAPPRRRDAGWPSTSRSSSSRRSGSRSGSRDRARRGLPAADDAAGTGGGHCNAAAIRSPPADTRAPIGRCERFGGHHRREVPHAPPSSFRAPPRRARDGQPRRGLQPGHRELESERRDLAIRQCRKPVRERQRVRQRQRIRQHRGRRHARPDRSRVFVRGTDDRDGRRHHDLTAERGPGGAPGAAGEAQRWQDVRRSHQRPCDGRPDRCPRARHAVRRTDRRRPRRHGPDGDGPDARDVRLPVLLHRARRAPAPRQGHDLPAPGHRDVERRRAARGRRDGGREGLQLRRAGTHRPGRAHVHVHEPGAAAA